MGDAVKQDVASLSRGTLREKLCGALGMWKQQSSPNRSCLFVLPLEIGPSSDPSAPELLMGAGDPCLPVACFHSGDLLVLPVPKELSSYPISELSSLSTFLTVLTFISRAHKKS